MTNAEEQVLYVIKMRTADVIFTLRHDSFTKEGQRELGFFFFWAQFQAWQPAQV